LFIIGPFTLIGEKRIPWAAEPSGIKGSCGKIFSVVLSTNADVNCAGFFIASAKSRCQAQTKKYFLATAVPAFVQNITRSDAPARTDRRSEARSGD